MKINIFVAILLCLCAHISDAQTLLESDGPGDTYELINSFLAPGYNVIEVPDCNHESFGRHIEEVFDSELNKHVFLFHIHTSPDNDKCQNFDRQRNEIKTYDKSPDSLLGHLKEKVEYRWKFKLDNSFQPSSSFTHLHQLKAVGGSTSSMPLITLTARKGNPNKLELRYADELSQSTIQQTELSPLLGLWLDVKETVIYDELDQGSYEILISDEEKGDTLFHYVNTSITMWKADAEFIRPKWGIYRSLNDSGNLRNEQVLFADFYIKEIGISTSTSDEPEQKEYIVISPNPTADHFVISSNVLEKYKFIYFYNVNGQLVLKQEIDNEVVSTRQLNEGLYFVQFTSYSLRHKPIKMIVSRL